MNKYEKFYRLTFLDYFAPVWTVICLGVTIFYLYCAITNTIFPFWVSISCVVVWGTGFGLMVTVIPKWWDVVKMKKQIKHKLEELRHD